MVNETLTWIDEGIKKCEEGKENPIILSALVFQRLVSIHPFTDGNGRTCRLAMDYTLRRLNLPPALVGKDVNVASFGDQPGKKSMIAEIERSPSEAAAIVFEGVKKSYSMLAS